MNSSEIPELSEEQQASLEGEITLKEAGTALKNMKNGKSPGTDSFDADLKKNAFGGKLETFLLEL